MNARRGANRGKADMCSRQRKHLLFISASRLNTQLIYQNNNSAITTSTKARQYHPSSNTSPLRTPQHRRLTQLRNPKLSTTRHPEPINDPPTLQTSHHHHHHHQPKPSHPNHGPQSLKTSSRPLPTLPPAHPGHSTTAATTTTTTPTIPSAAPRQTSPLPNHRRRRPRRSIRSRAAPIPHPRIQLASSRCCSTTHPRAEEVTANKVQAWVGQPCAAEERLASREGPELVGFAGVCIVGMVCILCLAGWG